MTILPAEHESVQPVLEKSMKIPSIPMSSTYRPSLKLAGKHAVITGGDSGIGRGIALHFSKEGCSMITIICLPNEKNDAEETVRLAQLPVPNLCEEMFNLERRKKLRLQTLGKEGSTSWTTLPAVSDPKTDLEDYLEPKRATVFRVVYTDLNQWDSLGDFCRDQVTGPIDILVNNAGVALTQPNIEDMNLRELEITFNVNVFSSLALIKHLVPRMKPGSTIINTAGVTGLRGHPKLVEYSAANGAILSFTKSLSKQLITKGIRVNAVAPGPIYTPMILASFSAEEVATFGESTRMERYGEVAEVAPSYVFLASQESSYMTGQCLHPNGGVTI